MKVHWDLVAPKKVPITLWHAGTIFSITKDRSGEGPRRMNSDLVLSASFRPKSDKRTLEMGGKRDEVNNKGERGSASLLPISQMLA